MRRRSDDPAYSRPYVGRGNILRDRRELDRALAEYGYALQLDPDNTRAYYGRAQAWSAKGEARKAAADFDQVLRLDPKAPSVYHARGQIWLDLKDYQRAISDFDRAIALDPRVPLYFQTRGWTQFIVGDADRALVDLDEAIRLDPKDAHAYFQRANVLSSRSQIDRAIADFGEAIRLVSNAPMGAFYRYHRGLAFVRKGDHGRAILDYDVAIDLDAEARRQDPTHVNCCFGRANLLFVVRGQARHARREYDLALANFDEAARLVPDDTAALIHRGNAWSAKQEHDRAIADYSDAIRIDAKNAVAYVGRGNVWHAKKRYDPAIRDYDEAIRINPKDLVALNNRGDSFAAAGNIENAVSDYRAALSQDPAGGHSRLGRLYSNQGRFADAEAEYQQALVAREKTVGSIHPQVADDIENLAWVASSLGRYGNAARLHERAVELRELLEGKDHPSVALSLAFLGAAYVFQSRYSEADVAYQRALAIVERNAQADDGSLARIYFGLGNLQFAQRHYSEAESAYERSLSLFEKQLNPDQMSLASALTGLGNARWLAGKYAESAQVHERALAIYERTVGPRHPWVALVLESLALSYRALDKYDEAEGLLKRSLAIREDRFDPDNLNVAHGQHSLADVYRLQGKFQEAKKLYARVLAIREQALGPDHPDTAQTLQNLADAYRGENNYAEAETLYNRSLAIRERRGGRPDVGTAWTLINLALMNRLQKRYDKAQELYERALAIEEETLGTSHPDFAYLLDDLAILHRAIGNVDQALAFSRRASASIVAHAAEQSFASARNEGRGGLIDQNRFYFVRHVFNVAAAADKGLEPETTLGEEAFEIAQWANHSSAAAAVQQLGARFASGNDALSSLVRQSQDLSAFWRGRNQTLVKALSEPTDERQEKLIEGIRVEIADAEGKLTDIARQLENEFPDYVSLARPKPLAIREAQRLLGADDALVFFLTGDSSGFVFALTQEHFEWKPIQLGTEALRDKIADFRRGLDVDAIDLIYDRIEGARGDELFDLDIANALYDDLLGPVEALIKEKSRLIVVPSGALTALPFHLLVTEPPSEAVPEHLSDYRDAAWLIKRQAVTVLPSVAGLKTLRAIARKDHGGKPLVGFGDPVFDRNELTVANLRRPGSRGNIRGYADFWKGAGIDRTELSLLPRLPETADELRTVAMRLGASASDIHLRTDASEYAVKHLPLANYRIVYFATHGLVAGDVEGLAEPALVLSMPATATTVDDGLLTASEAAQLKLNADWVVLSACNTIAGDKPGAEALSGLARAFFYAGARALLVSHWAVDSSAATSLTTTTFEILEDNPKLGHAEALRRAMLAYMNDTSVPRRAYPAIWAPFVVIGEGAPKHETGREDDHAVQAR
jgi:tetratricopeptide (TPR) repeat protein/CHAT domain-containing protein